MVAQTSDSVVFTSHGASERRPAIWPWLVMPLIVLVVFCILYKLRQAPDTDPASTEIRATASASAGTEP